MWCAISRNRIIFDDAINWERCYEVTFLPLYWALEGGWSCSHATTHTSRVSLALLCCVLRERITSEDTWPPWSPNFAPFIVFCGEEWKGHSLQRISAHSPWTERIHHKSNLEYPCDGNVACFENKIACLQACVCVCVWGGGENFVHLLQLK
jgi:hypothetical protein